eukprot:g19548.t1
MLRGGEEAAQAGAAGGGLPEGFSGASTEIVLWNPSASTAATHLGSEDPTATHFGTTDTTLQDGQLQLQPYLPPKISLPPDAILKWNKTLSDEFCCRLAYTPSHNHVELMDASVANLLQALREIDEEERALKNIDGRILPLTSGGTSTGGNFGEIVNDKRTFLSGCLRDFNDENKAYKGIHKLFKMSRRELRESEAGIEDPRRLAMEMR